VGSGESEIFSRLTGARRVWAVGAIHSEVDRLRHVHDQIQLRFAPGDRLVYLGNMIGRNPRVLETMDELLLFRRRLLAQFMLISEDIVYLRGAQEEMWHKMMQLHLAQSPTQVIEWMLAQGAGETLDAYGGTREEARARCREGPRALARWTEHIHTAVRARPGHDELITSVRRAAIAGDGEAGAVLFVNAGLDVSRPLEEQADAFWWDGARFDAIEEPYGAMRRIVRGYDSAHGGIRVGPVAATLDGGCGYGGALVAACLDLDGQIVDRVEA
jgi:hypothetical protein